MQKLNSGVINAVAGAVYSNTVLLQEGRLHKTEQEKKLHQLKLGELTHSASGSQSESQRNQFDKETGDEKRRIGDWTGLEA